MSMVMFVIGCVAVMIGVAMVGFGIPVNEFSFGNTLIVAGTTLATGGLIVIGLSAVVSQLHRIAESMAGRAMMPTRPVDVPEAPADVRTGSGRLPFPPKSPLTAMTRPPEAPMAPPVPADLDAEAPHSFAPAMRNPEAPPMTVEDEVSLSPQDQMTPPSPDLGPILPSAPARETPGSYFDSMWPAKPRTTVAAPPKHESKHEPKYETKHEPLHEMAERERESIARLTDPEPDSAPPRAAVLKSGVVDGMAYTLYVDGSIEAELPQGTLRFASIDELRSHLEQNN
jgi:hypothetical protein